MEIINIDSFDYDVHDKTKGIYIDSTGNYWVVYKEGYSIYVSPEEFKSMCDLLITDNKTDSKMWQRMAFRLSGCSANEVLELEK